METTGPYTVRITYKQPYAKALESWGVDDAAQAPAGEYVKEGKIKRGAAELVGARSAPARIASRR